MKQSTERLIVPRAFGFLGGRPLGLVRPYEVNLSLDAQYRCPECDSEVHLRREARSKASGEAVRQSHFAHLPHDASSDRSPCSGGNSESQQHRIAKLLVAQAVQSWINYTGEEPRFVGRCVACGREQITALGAADMVLVECRLPSGLVPDVLVGYQDKMAAIEVCHTSKVTPEKRADYGKTLTWWAEVSAQTVLDDGPRNWRLMDSAWRAACECRWLASKQMHVVLDSRTEAEREAWADRDEAEWVLRTARTCPGCGLALIGDDGICTWCRSRKRSGPFAATEATKKVA